MTGHRRTTRQGGENAVDQIKADAIRGAQKRVATIKKNAKKKRNANVGPIPESKVLDEHIKKFHMLGKQNVENVIEIGRRLVECKKLVGYGNFGPWLKTEFGWKDQTARNCMHVYELATEYKLTSKSPNFGELALSSLYLLAQPSTPKKVRDKIIAKARTAPVQHDESVEMVRASKESKDACDDIFSATDKEIIETPHDKWREALMLQANEAIAAASTVHWFDRYGDWASLKLIWT